MNSRGDKKKKSRNERKIDGNLQKEEQKNGWKGRFEGAVACKNVALGEALQLVDDRKTYLQLVGDRSTCNWLVIGVLATGG